MSETSFEYDNTYVLVDLAINHQLVEHARTHGLNYWSFLAGFDEKGRELMGGMLFIEL